MINPDIVLANQNEGIYFVYRDQYVVALRKGVLHCYTLDDGIYNLIWGKVFPTDIVNVLETDNPLHLEFVPHGTFNIETGEIINNDM